MRTTLPHIESPVVLRTLSFHLTHIRRTFRDSAFSCAQSFLAIRHSPRTVKPDAPHSTNSFLFTLFHCFSFCSLLSTWSLLPISQIHSLIFDFTPDWLDTTFFATVPDLPPHRSPDKQPSLAGLHSYILVPIF